VAERGRFLINSRRTTLMVDRLLGGFDMPVMIEFPIAAADVPKLDAVLVAHTDNDHYSVPTRHLAQVTGDYHSTQYVASLMKQEGFPAYGHDIGEHFAIGPVRVEVTPADHAWQNAGAARPTPPHRPAAVAVPPPERPAAPWKG
jgi:L-ascorbate metabolism protein UlaG (beta-lactamase superfamily)